LLFELKVYRCYVQNGQPTSTKHVDSEYDLLDDYPPKPPAKKPRKKDKETASSLDKPTKKLRSLATERMSLAEAIDSDLPLGDVATPSEGTDNAGDMDLEELTEAKRKKKKDKKLKKDKKNKKKKDEAALPSTPKKHKETKEERIAANAAVAASRKIAKSEC
jgi:hypothetical protein